MTTTAPHFKPMKSIDRAKIVANNIDSLIILRIEQAIQNAHPSVENMCFNLKQEIAEALSKMDWSE